MSQHGEFFLPGACRYRQRLEEALFGGALDELAYLALLAVCLDVVIFSLANCCGLRADNSLANFTVRSQLTEIIKRSRTNLI